MSKGLTLTEVMVSIAIVLVVTVVATPALLSARSHAKMSASMNRLRQLYLAVKLYQLDHEPSIPAAKASEMGLPSFATVASTRLGILDQEFWLSPCGWNPQVSPSPLSVSYLYRPSDDPSFCEYAKNYGENVLLFSDLHCDDSRKPLGAHFVSHRGLGVLLSGKAVNKFAPGDVFDDRWWSNPITEIAPNPFEE